MRSTPNRATACRRIWWRSRPAAAVTAATAVAGVVDDKAGAAVIDELGHRTAAEGDDRGAAGHGLDHAEAERLVEIDQVEQGVAHHRVARSGGSASTGPT